MKTLFRKKPTVKEQVRASQRELTRGTRDLDRELMQLKREEDRVLRDIKAAVREGNNAGAKVLARSLIRLRQQKTKLQNSKAQLMGVRTQVATATSTQSVGTAMQKASKAIAAVGKTTDPVKLQKSMAQFAMENEKMNMTSEIMDDALDNALDDDEMEDEADDVVNQVLDEIGIDVAAINAPRTKVAQARRNQEEDVGDLADRLTALR